MNVKNCRKCGRIYNYIMGPNICPRCKEHQEEKFQEVKKYIQDHAGAGMMEVSEECDVEAQQIQQWIREERLQFSDDSPIKVACEGCGTMIGSGRFCAKCKNDLTSGLRTAARQMKPEQEKPVAKKTENRIRFLDR